YRRDQPAPAGAL
ncbi:hypothetical protein MKD33_20795, partial [Chromobacterium piscinae]